MRSVLALCTLIALIASANAAAGRPQAKSRQAVAPGQAVVPGDITPRGARVFRDDSAPGGWRTDRDEPPSPNDPSRRGGG